jgi:hypothetical protein
MEDSLKKYKISCSHYFRSPPGNGKTIFLMLLKEELESRNLYDVYYFESAKFLDKYTEESFEQARDIALKENKTMVVMVDEVQHNRTACVWNYLLKKATDIIVIGVGIPNINITDPSPQFKLKYQPSVMYFGCNSEDMEELIDVFVKQNEGRDISREVITDICHFICDYSGGHMYPMLKFCEHIFDIAQKEYLDNYSKYLTSKNFFNHEDCQEVRRRCFDNLPRDPFIKILRRQPELTDPIDKLNNAGYWNEEKRWFISKFLVDIIFNTMIIRNIEFVGDVNFFEMSVENKIEKIIETGLSQMTPCDFKEPIDKNVVSYEEAIGDRWAYYIRTCFPLLHVATQVQGLGGKIKGKKPCIDIVCNGKGDVGFELVRNGTKKMCKEHSDRFDDKYKRWQNSGAILNFIINGDETVENLYESEKIPVFHFLLGTNTLYKGKKIFKNGVAKIPTPPIT